ncbi:MAG: hypothetical protein M1825_003327 [Sarcosagium campestre]|nr:MAG: hypothetical protein M1825_003327 [Sarcosagium campestre]
MAGYMSIAGGVYAIMNDASLTPQEALSGIFGSMSLAAWIFLLIPQLLENYKQGSAQGISLTFLAVWFIGDVTNFLGAAWAGLVPTVIALAVYFCFADLVLILQCLYYNFRNAREARPRMSRGSTQTDSEEDDEQPLLGRRESNIGLPGSRRRSSGSHAHRNRRGSDVRRSALSIVKEEESSTKVWIRNLVSVLLVCAVGAAGWTIAWRSGVWTPTPVEDGDESATIQTAVGAQILGYASAVCYLGARIPQIVKNYKDQSCEGLSLLFFILSLLGNATYGAGILFHSTGTMAEDVVIFIQFRLYSKIAEPSGSAVQ